MEKPRQIQYFRSVVFGFTSIKKKHKEGDILLENPEISMPYGFVNCPKKLYNLEIPAL
jgi:hypothetical protein